MKVAALVRRAGWNLGEQVVSSLTNSILSIIVANSVDKLTFGGFSVAFTVFALVIGGSRAISTSPLNIRFADCTPEESKRAAAAAAGNALVLGLVVGVVCVGAGLVLPDPLGQAMIALGIVMPALLVQDAYRYVFFANGRPEAAALSSGLWAVLQIGSVVALLSFGLNAVGLLLLAWGISAAAAATLSIKQAGARPAPRRAWGWAREHVDLTGYKLATFATAQGSTQGAILIIGVVATIATVGSLRGTQILLGPTSILALAALNFAVPELARRRSRLSDRQWMLAAVGVGGSVALLGFVWGAFFLFAPDSVGVFLLDDTWPGTQQILLAAVITQVFSCMSIGPVAIIYALDRASATLAIQIILGILTFGLSVGGVFLGGALGAQWGFALANAIVVPCWFLQLRRQLRMRAAEKPVEAVDPEGTTVLPARKPLDIRFEDDFATAQLSTMLLPCIEPRVPATPQPDPAPAVAPRPPAPRPAPPGLQAPRPSTPRPAPPRPPAPQPAPVGIPAPGPRAPRPGGPGHSAPPNLPPANRPGPNMPRTAVPGPNVLGPHRPGSNQPGPPRPAMPGPGAPQRPGGGPRPGPPLGRPPLPSPAPRPPARRGGPAPNQPATAEQPARRPRPGPSPVPRNGKGSASSTPAVPPPPATARNGAPPPHAEAASPAQSNEPPAQSKGPPAQSNEPPAQSKGHTPTPAPRPQPSPAPEPTLQPRAEGPELDGPDPAPPEQPVDEERESPAPTSNGRAR